MSEITQSQVESEFQRALAAVTAIDLATLIPFIERFGLAGELDLVVRTARPMAKVQRRFLPLAVQGDILKAGLRTSKGLELVQDCVVGLYELELGDDVMDPSYEQLSSASTAVRAAIADALVELTLLGVVARDEVAKPHALTILREQFASPL